MDEITPSGRELEILKVLWELGPSSVRTVYERMCPEGELAFNTVQTLLRIMDDKGLVSHAQQGHAFIYTARYSRKRTTSRFLQHVFDGAVDQVVLSMLSTADPSPEELKQLEKLIAEAQAPQATRSRRRRPNMPWQPLLETWLAQSALASLAVLAAGSAAVLVWRQPARRVRIIRCTMTGCILGPLIGMVPGYPRLAVDWPKVLTHALSDEPAGVGASRTVLPRQSSEVRPVVSAGVEQPFAADSPSFAPVQPDATAFEPQPDYRPWISALYLLGLGVGGVWWSMGLVALARVVRASRPAAPRCQDMLATIAGPHAQRVRLLVSRQLNQPLAATCGRPVIVLPESVCRDDRALRWSLAHEWAHVHRGDFRLWLVSGLVRVVFFYHPLVWWLRAKLRLCQDILADGEAARQTEQPEDYAEFLTIRAAAGSLRPAVAGLGMGFHRSELYRRVVMLVQRQPVESRAPRLWTLGTLLTAVAVIAVAAALSLSRGMAAEGTSGAAAARAAEPAAPSDAPALSARTSKPAATAETPDKAKAKTPNKLDATQKKPEKLDVEQLILMGRVEDFFMHNFRDITARKSLEWGQPEKHADGSASIRYMFEGRVWDRETMIGNIMFTFDKEGTPTRFENVKGYPKKKETKPVDTSTAEGVKELVNDFFKSNFRDVTSRKTLEWGDLQKQAEGNVSIRYKYEARIWDKQTMIMNQIFTFTPKGEYVSVKNVDGFPKEVKK